MKSITLRHFLVSALSCALLADCASNSIAQITGGPPQTSLPTSANGADLGGSRLNFQPDLFTGRFTFHVPIVVPPGRQNSQPKLALAYNSAEGNNWCGVGWDLQIGHIERQTRFGVPIKWATNGNAAQYDDAKSFTAAFSGISGDLVQVSLAGQSPVTYRLKVDKAYLTFLYYNQLPNAYWSVFDKAGMQYFFGESPTNRMDNPNFTGGYGTNTFRWLLDRIRDANGNETYFTYTNIGNQLYPLHVGYNANVNLPALPATHTVDFLLADRSDLTTTFKSGFRIENRKLLSQVVVMANGQKVRRYLLGYTNSPSTLRSLLASVTQYGSDDSTSLPPLTFNYQVKPFGFGPIQDWGGLNSQGKTNADWNSITATETDGNTYVRLIDMDGDGLPDRVMRKTNAPFTSFIVQRNTGSGFTGNYTWGGITNQGQTNVVWGSITVATNKFAGGTNVTSVDLFDINGDGRPDRVMTNFSSTANWQVQPNAGTPGGGFASPSTWGTLASGHANLHSESGTSGAYDWADQEMIDLNGDGLPDRTFGQSKVQLNTNGGFGPAVNFTGLLSTFYVLGNAGQAATPPYLPSYFFGQTALTSLIDMNGDGLPDVVQPVSPGNGYWYNYLVEYNDGSAIENVQALGSHYVPLLSEGFTNQNNDAWNGTDYSVDESTAGGNLVQMVKLIDINGDGLPDRVLTKAYAPFDRFKVQLNTGTGFGPLIDWTNVQSEYGNAHTNQYQPWNSINWVTNGQTVVTLVDINGDGLPDRVMRDLNAPYTSLKVQLNLGPFPDLLSEADNGLGGSVKVTYLPSSKYDNTDRTWVSDPWTEGARSMLPFPVYTVSSLTVNDGLGTQSTTSYSYKHGMFDPVTREFRGFNSVIATDPLGAQTRTFFHQSGGFDDSANGEFQDQGSFSKKGMPYRVEIWGYDGLLYNVVLNKIQEFVLNTNGWYFPSIAQTIVMSYEGQGTYRAIATQFNYDTNNENLIEELNYGEVTSIVVNGQTFTDIGNDSVYKWMTYTPLGNILDRPTDIKITSDSAGASVLRESLLSYDSNGNLKGSQSWLDLASSFILMLTNNYDAYGNLLQTTDAAGITTAITYDSTFEQYPVTQTIATFSSQTTYDPSSGLLLTATDAKGLVSSNNYDVFFRPSASYISTNPYGPPALWQTRTYYSLGGINSGLSYNYVHRQVNDAVDPVNGFETYTYADGIGRTIETRAEAENGQFRVANTLFDLRGLPYYQTLPYFNSGAAFTALYGTYLGVLTTNDPVGRVSQTTPAVQAVFNNPGQLQSLTPTGGDTGSPVATTTVAYLDGANPWARVVTDSEGKVKKSYRDAYGRTVTITELTSAGNYNTTYAYDLVGNLTNLTDAANNITTFAYDSLGRKKSMVEPDMGVWSYTYDNAGRLTQQVDARNNTLKFNYNDPIGRLISKQIYNAANSLVGTITYAYDTSGDPNYTVYPGQLYKVTDLQGYQRSSYDVRGRVLKSARFLNLNSVEYVTQATYDDADRLQQLTYPGSAATLLYSYDTAGHLSQVRSLAGTGTQEIFYTPAGFNALDQITGCTDGNGVVSTYGYFQKSARLQSLVTLLGSTQYQNLSYTYDTVSDVKSVNDTVNSGAASASLNNIVYDDLYRLQSLTSTARGAKAYAYNPIGNLMTNQDFGLGAYQYGPQPHAVTNANGTSYRYDACGNMVARGAQTLAYDEQNQLIQVSGPGTSVGFGYDASGERLWRRGTNGYSAWIGGIYEINDGKVLCHVLAEGKLVATFEPLCGGPWAKVVGEKRWYAASTTIDSALVWPLQKGRGPWTMLTWTWAAIIVLCAMAGCRLKLTRNQIRRLMLRGCLRRQALAFASISALLAAWRPNVDATTYNPVFYYYHPDTLGSANVLTDRSGNLVQHYEYTPFGQTGYAANTQAFPVSNRYTGQIADDETGLYYYGSRYYDTQLGRFIQPDPTVPRPGDPQSLNRYAYCRNNPLNRLDPTGHQDEGFEDTSQNFEDYLNIQINTTFTLDSTANIGYNSALNSASPWTSFTGGGTASQMPVDLFAGWSENNLLPDYGDALAADKLLPSAKDFYQAVGMLPGLVADVVANLFEGPIRDSANLITYGGETLQGKTGEGRQVSGSTAAWAGVSMFLTLGLGPDERLAAGEVGAERAALGAGEALAGEERALTLFDKAPPGFSNGNFGDQVHQNFEQALNALYNTEPRDWFMRTGPKQTGVDATYVGPASRSPGFTFGELKPYSQNSLGTFGNQLGNWGLPAGQTELFFYNKAGIIGSSGFRF